MAGFQFRLQALLDRRSEAKQQAEELLAERERELAAEQETAKELEDAAHRARELYDRKRAERFANGLHGGSTFSKRSDFLSGLKMDLEEAQSGVLAQQVFVDQ